MLVNFTIFVDNIYKDELGLINPLYVLKHNQTEDIVCTWNENINAIEKLSSN
jgi:hypothetical protein